MLCLVPSDFGVVPGTSLLRLLYFGSVSGTAMLAAALDRLVGARTLPLRQVRPDLSRNEGCFDGFRALVMLFARLLNEEQLSTVGALRQ
eukprot:2000072-Rhodomonas_salina.2